MARLHEWPNLDETDDNLLKLVFDYAKFEDEYTVFEDVKLAALEYAFALFKQRFYRLLDGGDLYRAFADVGGDVMRLLREKPELLR